MTTTETSRWGPLNRIEFFDGGPLTWWEYILLHIGEWIETLGLHVQICATARVDGIERANLRELYGTAGVFVVEIDGAPEGATH
jgi:hypothetical protein